MKPEARREENLSGFRRGRRRKGREEKGGWGRFIIYNSPLHQM
jgi:hypothetical protein